LVLAGPEQARLIEEFEKQFLADRDGDYLHHDGGFSIQYIFQNSCSFFGGEHYRH